MLTGNMDVFVFDWNGVYTKFFWYEMDCVEAVLNFIDFSIFRYASGRSDCGTQVERCDTCNKTSDKGILEIDYHKKDPFI